MVARKEQLSPQMVRVIFTGPDLSELPDLTFTDHYIKILFPPRGADYAWPFDVDELKQREPAERWPVTRTYTIRSFDRTVGELAVDFVLHGGEGVAGPWAAQARPGDALGFFGPGGSHLVDDKAEAHLLVGDEAALPAIAVTLEQIDDDVPTQVFLEVDGAADHQPLAVGGATVVHWVHRSDSGLDYGQAVAAAVRATQLPTGRLQAFVHGNADMVRDLRRYLFLERGLDRQAVSISGYWRTGHTEDRWQATKGAFNRQMEAEEAKTS